MSERYTPELGQMAHGQPWFALECPDAVIAALQDIRERLNAWDCDPFGNSGHRFGNGTFVAEAYDWGDDEQPYNFLYGYPTLPDAIKVRWYKWLGRGTTINRVVSDDEIAAMREACLKSLGR